MKMRNRLLAVLLTLVMIVGMLPIIAFAENDPPAAGTDVVIENVQATQRIPWRKPVFHPIRAN